MFGQKLLRRSHARRRGKSLLHPNAAAALGARFCRGLSVATAGLGTSADLRRSLALSKRFPADG